MLSSLKHREWNWKDILEKLENLFRKKVEGYSQSVDNFIWIRRPLCHAQRGQVINALATS